jgi:hypothetical protein
MRDWTVDARCRDKVTIEGEAWEAAFADADLTYKPVGEYSWPKSTLEVMVTCAGCPVRRECLEYGFELEHTVLLGTRSTNDEEYEATGKSYIEETLKPMPAGVYGGVPGPMRERFGSDPDRLELADAWFISFTTERGWATEPAEEVA